MPSDLTERLAAKLSSVREPWGFAWESESPEGQTYAELVADYAPTLLPLLLSEPELVASLSEEVRVKALESLLNSAPVMESAFVDAAEVLALAPEELRLSVLTPRERAVMKLGEADLLNQIEQSRTFGNGYDVNKVNATYNRYKIALADVQALTPEGKDG